MVILLLFMIIAVAGKGGTGKTTIAALIIETLRHQGKKPILAVDADPNSTLGEYLGIKYARTISDLIDETKGLRDLPDGVSKPAHLEYQLQQAITESPGVDLLVMGRPEGPDCYCMANNILRDYMHKIVRNYPYVVMDNEAGMEHLSRKTTSNIDALVMVTDPTVIGLKTVKRIKELIDGMKFLKIKKKYLLVNKTEKSNTGNLESILQSAEFKVLNDILLGFVPNSKELIKLGQTEEPISQLSGDDILFKVMDKLVNQMMDKASK